MKYIFLDIDGVLWTVGWDMHCLQNRQPNQSLRQWDPVQTSLLQMVLNKCKEAKIEVSIVISSSWRVGRTLKQLKSIAKKSGLDPDYIIDTTPVLEVGRGLEIQNWMTKYSVKELD